MLRKDSSGLPTASSSSDSSMRGRTARAPSCSSPTTCWSGSSPRCPRHAGIYFATSASSRATHGSAEKLFRTRPLIRVLPRLRLLRAISSSSTSTLTLTSLLREKDGPGCSDMCSRQIWIFVRAAVDRCAGSRRRLPESLLVTCSLGSGSGPGRRRLHPARRSRSSRCRSRGEPACAGRCARRASARVLGSGSSGTSEPPSASSTTARPPHRRAFLRPRRPRRGPRPGPFARSFRLGAPHRPGPRLL